MFQVPRQTLDRWKRSRHQSQSFDDDGSGSGDSTADTVVEDGDGRKCLPAEEHFHQASSDNVLHLQQLDCTVDELSVSETESVSDSEGSSGLSVVSSSDDRVLSGDYPNSDEMELGNDSSASSDIGDNVDDEKYLYPGSEKRIDEAVLELLDIYIKNNITKTSLDEILQFYVSSLPVNHNMPPTVYHLFNFVKRLSIPMTEVQHFYCSPKLHPAESRSSPCSACGSSDMSVFFELPVDIQIRFLFEHRNLSNVIDSYSAKRSHVDGEICDVLDGAEYLRVWEGVHDRYKVTLILNTDGVQPYHSSAAKLWPRMFTIMEVPPDIRSSFIIVWGVWFDKSQKPDMDMYLKPFVLSLAYIHSQGRVSWNHPDTGIEYKSHTLAPLVVADAPARANVQGIKEHNAKYACNTCEQKTNKLPAPPIEVGKKREKRKRRFLFKDAPAQLRTHERLLTQGEYVLANNLESTKGVKRTDIVSQLPKLDLSTCVVPEYMHSVLKGVVMQITSLWLFVKGDWYIGEHLDEMNHFITHEIHPPDFVTRLPRSLKFFSYFKANEMLSWLLYYSLIVISPFMKDKYTQHLVLFVNAIYLLLQGSITRDDLASAEAVLRMFVRDVGALYGDQQYTYNVHHMSHLVLYVERWGPLWATSAFPFESYNGVLAKMIHGSKNEGKELVNGIFLAQGLQMLQNMVNQERSAADTGYVEVLGKPLSRRLNGSELNCLRNLDLQSLKLYGRVGIGKERFSSKEYDMKMKRNNSFIELTYECQRKYGRIVVFWKSEDRVSCLVSLYRVVHVKFFFHRASMVRIKHIIRVEDSRKIVVCDVSDLVQKLIQVGDFLCLRPNTVERNL